jgi:hypothetical protein
VARFRRPSLDHRCSTVAVPLGFRSRFADTPPPPRPPSAEEGLWVLIVYVKIGTIFETDGSIDS